METERSNTEDSHYSLFHSTTWILTRHSIWRCMSPSLIIDPRFLKRVCFSVSLILDSSQSPAAS